MKRSSMADRRRSEPTTEGLVPLDPAAFHESLSRWYKRHARDLPWRGVDDPYATWLSEIMLQQTRVATVIERYREFLLRFPTIRALAAGNEEDVLALWSGLGYYRRARMLHRAAQFVLRELAGKLPRTAAELRTLPGVGDYTSAAIASIAFGECVAVVDGNVERVLLRILGRTEERSAEARELIRQTAQSLLPPQPARRTRANPCGDHNQAMMELGATICLPKSPLCLHCPVLSFCRTRGEHPTPQRSPMKSRSVAYLLAHRRRGTRPEILLTRRPPEASLMPNMFELPPLALDAVEGLEPALRVRHAITDTNYYVTIYTERAPGLAFEAQDPSEDSAGPPTGAPAPSLLLDPEDLVFIAGPHSEDDQLSLLANVAIAADDLEWVPAIRLAALPLTGLARKVLRRMGVLAVAPPSLT